MLKDATMHAYLARIPTSHGPENSMKVCWASRREEEYAGGVVYECGGATAFLYSTPNAGTSKASQAFWTVPDVEKEVADLKARGVTFEEYDMPGLPMQNSIVTGGGAKTAWFKDTEGNILAVSQRIA